MPLLYVLILITSLVCPSFTQVIVQFDKSMFTLGVNILFYSKNNIDIICCMLLPSYSAFVCLYDGSWTTLNFIKDIFIHERPTSVLLYINLCAYIFTRFTALRVCSMLGDSSQVELITKHAITNNLILHNVCSIKYYI